MNKFLETILNIYRIVELRERIILTLGMLLVYRIGAQVVLPGIDPVQLSELTNTSEDSVRRKRTALKISPEFKKVDTLENISLKLNLILEKMVLKNVDQWIWSHNRWK